MLRGSWGEGAFSSQEEKPPLIWKQLPAAAEQPSAWQESPLSLGTQTWKWDRL